MLRCLAPFTVRDDSYPGRSPTTLIWPCQRGYAQALRPTVPAESSFPVIPDHGTSPVTEVILNLLNQPLHQLSITVGELSNAMRSERIVPRVLVKLLISRIFEPLKWLLLHIEKFGVVVMQQQQLEHKILNCLGKFKDGNCIKNTTHIDWPCLQN